MNVIFDKILVNVSLCKLVDVNVNILLSLFKLYSYKQYMIRVSNVKETLCNILKYFKIKTYLFFLLFIFKFS